MYKRRDRQINFDDFNQPFGIALDPDNRWVKKAALIPWEEIEKDYARLFPSREGQVSKTARLALGALIIQKEYGFSDDETALMIQENPYFQYFCGIRKFTQTVPFDPSSMVHFRKRFTPDMIAGVNEKIIGRAAEAGKECGGEENFEETNGTETKPDGSGHPPASGLTAVSQQIPSEVLTAPGTDVPLKGTMIVDATCAPVNIKYPTDTDILNKAREDTESMISLLHNPSEGHRPRTYARTARKEYVNFSRKRHKTSKEIRRMIFRQLACLKRNTGFINSLLASGKSLPDKWISRFETVCGVYGQQKQMYESKSHTVPERIVSLSRPWIRPIVRGKTNAPVEFGVKLDVSVVDGFTRLEHCDFSAYNESGQLIGEIGRYKERTGFYPQRVPADKIYRNRENLKYCKEHGIRLSGPALGRRPKDFVPDREQEYRDICGRTEVERVFSLAKRRYGLGVISARLQETMMSSVALSVMLLNLNKVLFCTFILTQLYIRIMIVKFRKNQTA
jgi:hypothetical protein